jgi:hypothetical protein
MIVLPRTTLDDREVQDAVDRVLNTRNWPIHKSEDDPGLEDSEYFEFAMAVLQQLEQNDDETDHLYASLLATIDTVDAAALTVLIRALRIVIEARKGEFNTAEVELFHESYRVALAFKRSKSHRFTSSSF